MCSLWVKNSAVENAADKRKVLLGILADIHDQRAKLKLEFDVGVTSIKNLTASPVKYDISGVTVEVSALKTASERWVGSRVSCYFRVRGRENAGYAQFLTFSSVIRSVQQQPNGMVWFVLALPEGVANAQQRRCVRVEVDQTRVPVVTVWRQLAAGARIAGSPPLLESVAEAKPRFRMGNISTHGMRLMVENSLMHEALPRQSKGEYFSMYFEAVSEPGEPAEPFYVTAILRNIFSDPQQGETSMGFEFTDEGELDEKGRIVWEPLKSGEVSNLGAYIFKWNLLDFHREKRIA